jgi:potassium efflux system protein
MIRNLLLACLLAAALSQAAPGLSHAQTDGTGTAPSAPPPAGSQPATAAGPAALAASPAPSAPSALPEEVTSSIGRLTTAIEAAEKSLGRMREMDIDIARLRDEVEDVLMRATELADQLRPRLTEIRSQIEKLGPPPPKDAQPPEAPAVTAERTRLTNEAAALDGAIKTLEVTWVRARQAIVRITDLRLAMFTRSLLERNASPLLPPMWRDAVRDAPQVQRLLVYIASDWWRTMERTVGTGSLLLLLAVAAGAYLAGRTAVMRLTKVTRAERERTPSFFEQAATASWVAPLRAAPALLAIVIVYTGLDALELLYYPSAQIAITVTRSALIFVAVAALIATVLSPSEARRRLVPLSDRSALRVCRILQGIVAIYAADLALISITRTLYLPLSLTVVQSLLASLALAGMLILLLRTRFEPRDANPFQTIPRDHPRWLKIPLWFATVIIIVACLTGFVALGRFAAQQLVLTGVVAVVCVLLFLAIRAFTRDPVDARMGQVLEARFGIDGPRRQQLAWLTEVTLTLVLIIGAVPVILLQWGFSGADIRDWAKAAIFGFEIGQFRISLARIVIGIVLFTILLFLTRVLQRWLREQVLGPRVDPGIASSVDTAVGYAGILLAGVLAISYAGLDITNIAIVAGALSVGIGFGLQSIVNNFVSGLILLIERPIKVGDWVVIGGEQGNVRRVSVRSTEIETFDKASLIVPNAELISSRVLNWTHRNTLGRIILNVKVAPECDPRAVIALLERCARNHPHVLPAPEPRAYLENLSASALEFSLRVHLGDVNRALDVRSELRVAFLEAFRDARIAIV